MFRGVLVLEVALFVEAFRSVGDHHFGPIHGVHVEEHEDLAQVVLGAGGAEGVTSRMASAARMLRFNSTTRGGGFLSSS